MLTYGFYNSVNNDRKYNAEHFSSLFDGIITDGVFMTIGNVFAVAPSSGMQLSVDTGRAWFNRTWNNNDAIVLVTIPASEVVLSRIDAVVLEVNSALGVRVNSIKVIKGTPGSSPSRPTLTKSEFVNQYPLAYVSVAPTVTEIVSGDITQMVGTSECPWVTGILETVNSAMLDQIQAYLASIVELTNTLTIMYYTGKTLTSVVEYWEDDVTKKSEDILNYTDGKLTSVTTNLYDAAGTLKTTYTETLQYADGKLDRIRKVVL